MTRNTHVANSHAERKERREAATMRQELRAMRNDEDQISWLDERLGSGQGAHKERARLGGGKSNTNKKKKAKK